MFISILIKLLKCFKFQCFYDNMFSQVHRAFNMALCCSNMFIYTHVLYRETQRGKDLFWHVILLYNVQITMKYILDSISEVVVVFGVFNELNRCTNNIMSRNQLWPLSRYVNYTNCLKSQTYRNSLHLTIYI